MVSPCVARSISRPVLEQLYIGAPAHVLASSPRGCALLASGGYVMLIVPPAVGDGPLNIVVDAQFEEIDRQTPVTIDEGILSVGRLAVSLHQADPWEPRPEWDRLVTLRPAALQQQLAALCDIAEKLASPESLFWSIVRWRRGRSALSRDPAVDPGTVRARRSAIALAEGWGGRREQTAHGAAGLAGLGRGLTPAGDDFLMGVMLWAWLARPSPRDFCRVLNEAAASRTTMLSAALLRAAADGQFSAPLHQLLDSLAGTGELEAAAARVLSYGATSGADTLAGFLWIGMSGWPPAQT